MLFPNDGFYMTKRLVFLIVEILGHLLFSFSHLQETTCTEKDGWCIKDISDKCRNIMYKYTERLLSRDDTVQMSFSERKCSASTVKGQK